MDELSAVLKARELVSLAGPGNIPAPLEAYAERAGATIRVEHDLGPGEAGYCLKVNDTYRIRVNGNDLPERQRFTACHEIAHIVLGLPSEHEKSPSLSYASRSPNEILCDVFAAELLLPFMLFKRQVDRAEIGLASIDRLAGDFVASVMATGSRFAALSSSPCAFVYSDAGRVRYASRSTPLRNAGAWIAPGTPLAAESVSFRTRAGGGQTGAEEIGADVWFNDWSRGGTLLEEARHLGKWDQTITLLWFEDEEVPAQNTRHEHGSRTDDEAGLRELDGVLPWPGKKRRK